jgi:ribonuclease HI
MAAKKKFYAVAAGRETGVFENWSDCEKQVKGFSGAKFKSFESLEEATAFVKGSDLSEKGSSSPLNPQIPTNDYAFVDGSYNASTGVYGYGGFIYHNGERILLSGHGDDPEMAGMRNVAGEILGAEAAIRKADELGLSHITVLYDYSGIECWADGSWKANKFGTARYRDVVKEFRDSLDISFVKVAAHTGIEGNELADRLAKEAVGIAVKKEKERGEER